MNDEKEDRDANAGIRHVESRPGMSQRDVQIEQQKINDVAVQQPIGQIPKNPGEEQTERDIPPDVPGPPPHQQRDHEEQRHAGNGNEKSIVISEGTEGRAGVGHMNQIQEAGNNHPRLFRINRLDDQVFGELIDRPKR